MNTAQKAAILAMLLAVITLSACSKDVVVEIIEPEPAAEEAVIEEPAQEAIVEPKITCNDTIISQTGKFCYKGTRAENNDFKVIQEFHAENDKCSSHLIYPAIKYQGNLSVTLNIEASADLDAYLTDNNKTAFERCDRGRELRYIKFYNLEDPVEDEIIIYPDYYLLFRTEADDGIDVKIEVDYSENVKEQCSCEE